MEFQENSHRGRIFENVTSILQKKRILKGFILPLGNAFLAISFLVFMAIKLFFYKNLASLLDFRESHA